MRSVFVWFFQSLAFALYIFLSGCYDPIVTSKYLSNQSCIKKVSIRQNNKKAIAESDNMSKNILGSIKIANFRRFSIMTSHDDVTIKYRQYICTLLLNSFHLRYHSTISGQKRKSTWFSAHCDVTIWIFLESVTSSKDSPHFKEGPCQVLAKSLEPFLRDSNPPFSRPFLC